MRENIDVFALALTAQDMTRIAAMDTCACYSSPTATPPRSANPATSASTDRP